MYERAQGLCEVGDSSISKAIITEVQTLQVHQVRQRLRQMDRAQAAQPVSGKAEESEICETLEVRSHGRNTGRLHVIVAKPKALKVAQARDARRESNSSLRANLAVKEV